MKKKRSKKIKVLRHGKRATLKAFMSSLSPYILIFAFILPAIAANDPGEKLAEGVEEVSTGWTEVPKEIAETSEEENIVEGVTKGTVEGAKTAVEVTADGIVKVSTFYVPEDDE